MDTDIYYHPGLQDFTKLAKYRLYKGDEVLSEAGIAWRIQIIRNKHVALTRRGDPGTKPIILRIPDYIQSLLIELMRNPSVPELFRVKLYAEGDNIWCKFYINTKYITDICTRYGLAPSILTMVIRNTTSVGLTKPQYNEDEIPIYRNESQIWLLNYDRYLKISPYGYQHNNIHWLKAAEDSITRGERVLEYIETTDLTHFKTKKFDYYLDPTNTILYDHDSIWNCSSRCHKFVIKGGVLCDEVGLGKTLSMTGLILSDKYSACSIEVPKASVQRCHIPSQASSTDRDDRDDTDGSEDSVPVKLKIKAKVKPKPTPAPAPAPEPADPTPTVKKKICPIIRKDAPPIKIEFKPTLYKALRTTLVMCPRRLVNQWITEIARYTNHLRVVEMSTLTNVKKYECSDLDNIDVVVASFSLFDNKNYLTQDYFQLDSVHWRRVIIDEGHEVLLHNNKKLAADKRISTAIFSIKSDFRWVCTGTPLPSTEASMQAILSYLNDLGHNELSPLLNNITTEDYARLLELVFHRNTRQSVKEEVTIPKHREIVEFLDFTKTEQAIYNSVDPADTTRKLQVCTNLSVSDTDNDIIGGNVMNLAQVTKAMGAYYMQTADRLEARIETYHNQITAIEEELDTELEILNNDLEDAKAIDDKQQVADIKDTITKRKASARNRTKTIHSHIGECRLELNECRKQLQTFRSLDLDHISKSTCPVLGTKLTGKVAITPEGYYYSMKGIELLFLGGRKVANCACTRHPIALDSLTFVDTTAKDEHEEEVDVERAKWGTKMSHIVNKLRQLFVDDPDAKIIIFSQWQKMLILMAKALKDCNINCVFCRGNVHMMSKSIRSFKTDDKTRVILLSSDSCNSGSNLTEAPYVFLIDAVSGDIEHAKAAETQAIARTCRIGQTKEVQVFRFVIRNTIEEEYYKKMLNA